MSYIYLYAIVVVLVAFALMDVIKKSKDKAPFM